MTRIGLTQRVSVVEDYGERRDCLDQEWTTLVENFGFTPIPLPNTVADPQSYLNALDVDGVILTSGNDLSTLDDPDVPAPERDEFEKAVLDSAIDEELPVLGVCRGLELINTYFGGSLTTVDGHVDQDHQIRFKDVGEGLQLPSEATVNSYHGYGIDSKDIGDDLVTVGRVLDSTIEFVTHATHPIWGMMWHPERKSPSEKVDRQIINHIFKNESQ